MSTETATPTPTESMNKVKDKNRAPSQGQVNAHKRYCRICISEHTDEVNRMILNPEVRPGEIVEQCKVWDISIDYESISRHRKYLPYLVAGVEDTAGIRDLVLSSETQELRGEIGRALANREATAATVAAGVNRALSKVLDVIEAKAEDATFDALVRAADTLSRAAAVASGYHPGTDPVGVGSAGPGINLSEEATDTLEQVLAHLRANTAKNVTPESEVSH